MNHKCRNGGMTFGLLVISASVMFGIWAEPALPAPPDRPTHREEMQDHRRRRHNCRVPVPRRRTGIGVQVNVNGVLISPGTPEMRRRWLSTH